MPPLLVLVVPCYNEAQRLDTESFVEFARRHSDVEFLFVNDGSTDGTERALSALVARCGGSVLSLERNSGKAEAVRRGMLAALDHTPRYAAYWDADLATPLDTIDEFLELLEHDPQLEMVFGSRVRLLGRQIEREAARHYLGRIFATAASLVLRLPVYDTQCGAKMFRVTPSLRELFAEPFRSTWIFDVEVIARAMLGRGVSSSLPLETVLHEHPLRTWIHKPGSKVTIGAYLIAARDLWRIHRAYVRTRPATITTASQVLAR